MHPEFSQMAMRNHERDLDRAARSAYLTRPEANRRGEVDEVVVLRLCRVGDDAALDRLAVLEGRPAAAAGRHVVAEVDGAVIAAVSLVNGEVIADPFRRTAHILPLLELRARQLAPQTGRIRVPALFSAVRGWSRA